jgi:NAD(P)H-dependent FMN reductase
MVNLHIVVGSVRPGRGGIKVAEWLYELAKKDGSLNVEIIDLAAVNLPLMDEPNHPRLQKYTQQHTRDWSALIDRADAFLFVSPEYNYSIPASLKNALDYLSVEWSNKPAALATYGGVSGGLRAAQHLKDVLGAFNSVILNEAVVAPFYLNQIVEGVFEPTEVQVEAAKGVLKKLKEWHVILEPVRPKKSG